MTVNGDTMCLILFSYTKHPGYRLVLVANRDEFYDRPTLPLAAWQEAPTIYAGRDVKGSGTWLGVSRCGRLAALTNYRDPAAQDSQAPSRGLLISRFLKGADTPENYLEKVRKSGHRYNGFNLLVGDQKTLCYYSNRGDGIASLRPGLYGLSNHLLDTAWPKVARGKHRLKKILDGEEGWGVNELFGVLSDRAIAPDDQLPDTGVGRDWERLLSPLFITSPTYGTRSSSVLLITNSEEVTLAERSFGPNPPHDSAGIIRREQFTITSAC
jgi:uncharacterized protein with NRDE domain